MVGKIKYVLFFILLGSFNLKSQNVKAKPEPGDGIERFLSRYNLYQFSSNRDSFLKINNLSSTDFLKMGEDYLLPIKYYSYNGKSIRTSIGDNDYEKALRIKAYNEILEEQNIKSKSYFKDKVLWVPYHELFGNVILQKDNKSVEQNDSKEIIATRTYDIFGDKYKKVDILSSELKGKVYYIISGHGGPDPGARCQKEGVFLCEDEYAYDISLRLARNLIKKGARVYIIVRDNDGIRDERLLACDYDEVYLGGAPLSRSQGKRLRQRGDIINRLYNQNKNAGFTYQRAVVVHVDSRQENQKVDLFFYHFPGSRVGYNLAETMLKRIQTEYSEHQTNRSYTGVVKSRNLFMLRETKPTTVYIELGNITNEFDQKRLLIENNRQALANWLALGLEDDLD